MRRIGIVALALISAVPSALRGFIPVRRNLAALAAAAGVSRAGRLGRRGQVRRTARWEECSHRSNTRELKSHARLQCQSSLRGRADAAGGARYLLLQLACESQIRLKADTTRPRLSG